MQPKPQQQQQQSQAHATPEQAWRMFQSMRARHLAPMHHSTFKLSDEPADEPMQRLIAASGNAVDRIVCAGIGDAWGSGSAVAIPDSGCHEDTAPINVDGNTAAVRSE